MGACRSHTALYVPSYYDYVRVRNELLRREQVHSSSDVYGLELFQST